MVLSEDCLELSHHFCISKVSKRLIDTYCPPSDLDFLTEDDRKTMSSAKMSDLNNLLKDLHDALQKPSYKNVLVEIKLDLVKAHPDYNNRKNEHLASITINQAHERLYGDDNISTKCPADHSRGFCDFNYTKQNEDK